MSDQSVQEQSWRHTFKQQGLGRCQINQFKNKLPDLLRRLTVSGRCQINQFKNLIGCHCAGHWSQVDVRSISSRTIAVTMIVALLSQVDVRSISSRTQLVTSPICLRSQVDVRSISSRTKNGAKIVDQEVSGRCQINQFKNFTLFHVLKCRVSGKYQIKKHLQ